VFEDSKVTDFNQAATREETALYIWNTMWIQLVGYDVDLNYYDGREYREGGRYYPLTFAHEAFNLVWEENLVVIANQATGSEYTVVAPMYSDGTVGTPRYLDIETDLSYIGRDVDAFYAADPQEDKINHLDYFQGYLVTIESVPFDKGAKMDDFYRAAKDANKANVNVEFDDVPVWTNYDYAQLSIYTTKFEADGTGYIADADDAARHYYTVVDLKGQKSSNDSAPSGTWILNRSGEIMLVLKTNYRVAKVKAVDTVHEEVELDVYLPGTVYPDIYDMSWNDTQLVYDGIAKDDYVQVQPVGDLFYVKPTTTKTVDVFEVISQFFAFNGFAFSYDSYGYGITIPDQDQWYDVGVGDKVKFYVIEGAYGDSYFGLEIVEKAKSEGIIYVVSVGEYIDHSEWDTTSEVSTAWKVQGINQEGEEVVYKITDKDVKDGKVVLPAEDSVVEVRKQGKTYFFDKNVKNVASLSNDGTKSTYLESASDIYYVTEDTKVIYFEGKGKDLEITVANKLAKDKYDVYAVTKKSGGNYKLNTVWVLNDKVEAPEDYSADSIIYIGGIGYFAYVPCYQPVGSDYDDNEESAYYYYVYIDGVLTKAHLTGEASVYDPFMGSYGWLNEGFYQFKPADDGSGKLVLKEVKAEKVNEGVELVSGSVKNGKLYAKGSDGIALKVTIVDVSYDTTKETKTDASVMSLDRLEELLDEGYKMTADYMFTKSADGDEIPVGVMYITSVTPPTK
jgi:hypothetical protein